MLYLLDLTFRLAQWMNVSVVTGSILSEDVLALHLTFSPVRTRLAKAAYTLTGLRHTVFMNCSHSSWLEL